MELTISFGAKTAIATQSIYLSAQSEGFALKDILCELAKNGYPIKSSTVFYYSPIMSTFVNCGVFGSLRIPHVPADEVTQNHGQLLIHLQTIVLSNATNNNSDKSSSKTKERRIGYLMEVISLWKRLLAENPEATPEEISTKVGLPKKVIQEYINLIKAGKKYEFDFRTHWNEKISVLRQFVEKKNLKANNNGFKKPQPRRRVAKTTTSFNARKEEEQQKALETLFSRTLPISTVL